jgi:hypothetical protein
VLVLPRTTPDFLYAALDTSAYAAFFTESRTRLSDSNKLHRIPGSVLGYSQPSPFDKLRAGSTGLIAICPIADLFLTTAIRIS